jgi:hypothetical protein
MALDHLLLALDPGWQFHFTDVGAIGEDRAHARLRDLDPLGLQEARQLTDVGTRSASREQLNHERALRLIDDHVG